MVSSLRAITVPRAPLPLQGVPLGVSHFLQHRSTLLDPLRSYWLMRQAKPLSQPRFFALCRESWQVLRTPAGSWPFPTLSPQSLYRRLDPYPAALLRCFRSFLPGQHRPHLSQNRFGALKPPSQIATSTMATVFGAAVIPLCPGSHTC